MSEMKACCSCGTSAPVETGKILAVKGRSNSVVKRFFCGPCAARKSKRVAPVNHIRSYHP